MWAGRMLFKDIRGRDDSMDRSPTETSATQWDDLLCLPGPRHQVVHSHSSGLGEQSRHSHKPSMWWMFRASRQHVILCIYTLNSLSAAHTHIKFMGHSVKLLCSSSAVRLCQWPAATVPLLSLLLSCSSEAQLELAVMGLSSSRSRGAGLSWRLLKQVLQTRLGSNSCWLGTGIFWSQQLAQNTLPQFLQGDTDGSLLDSQTEPLYTYSYHASPLYTIQIH